MRKLGWIFGLIMMGIVFNSCKGEKGDRGPAGVTRTVYEDRVPTELAVDGGAFNSVIWTVPTSALGTNSSFEVYLSTDSIRWNSYLDGGEIGIDEVNLSSKEVNLYAIFTDEGLALDWDYTLFVDNPN